jgi:hypothetical protein
VVEGFQQLHRQVVVEVKACFLLEEVVEANLRRVVVERFTIAVAFIDSTSLMQSSFPQV